MERFIKWNQTWPVVDIHTKNLTGVNLPGAFTGKITAHKTFVDTVSFSLPSGQHEKTFYPDFIASWNADIKVTKKALGFIPVTLCHKVGIKVGFKLADSKYYFYRYKVLTHDLKPEFSCKENSNK